MNIDPAKSRQIFEHKHGSPLLACAFDATGRFVLAGGRQRELVCLDVAAGKNSLLTGHETWVGTVIRAGAELVLTADYSGKVIAWDCTADSPAPRWKINAHVSTIHALAVTPDGTRFATGGRNGTIRIWQTSDGQRAQEIEGLKHPVYGLAFHPDGQQLVWADRQPEKPRLKLWDLASGRERRCIEVPQLSAYRRVEDIEWGGIRAITLSPDGNTLVACGRLGYSGPASALLFDVTTGELKRTLSSDLKGYCYSAQYHAQGFLLVAGGDIARGEFRAWDPGQDESLAVVSTPGPCTALDIHPAGQRLVCAQMNGNRSYPDSGSLTMFEWTS